MKVSGYYYKVMSKMYGCLYSSTSLHDVETEMMEDDDIRDCIEFGDDITVLRYKLSDPDDITQEVLTRLELEEEVE
jgi:hypothetical protein